MNADQETIQNDRESRGKLGIPGFLHIPGVQGLRGMRAQTTLISGVIVLAASIVGSLFLSANLHNRLLDNFDTTLQTRAVDRATLIAGGATPADLTTSLVHESLIWIGTSSGQTLASAGLVVIDGSPAGTSSGITSIDLEIIEEDGEIEIETVRVATVAAKNPDGDTVLVTVGAELELVDDPVDRMRFLLLVGSPSLTALVMMLVWLTANRALRPVEDIRSTAARIHGDNRDERIPLPDTGDEVERLALTVNQMLDRLSDHHDRQEQFVGDASHELKSPIANMRTELDTTTSTDPAWPKTRGHLVEQTDRLAAIIDDLLVLAAHDEEAEFDHETIDLDDLVLAETEAVAGSSNLNLDVWDMEPVRVVGNVELLRRAVRNVVENAVRHADSTIKVEVRVVDGGLAGLAEVRVIDDGEGIAEKNRERVFERFARLDDARARHEGGTGLGLAIARETFERFDGSVSIGAVNPDGTSEAGEADVAGEADGASTADVAGDLGGTVVIMVLPIASAS